MRCKRAFVCVLLGLWCMDAHAQERTTADHVIVPHGSGEYELRLHPAAVTVLYFPDELQAVAVSNRDSFRVRAAGHHSLSIRPKKDVALGPRGTIRVVTPTMRVSFRLNVVERVERATLQRTFVRRRRTAKPRPAPPTGSQRLGLSVQGLFGLARLGDGAADGHQETYLAGTAARLSYAMHDRVAYELELSMARSGVAQFANVNWDGEMGDIQRITEFGRALAGIRLRLGAVYAPTVHLAVGGQTRPATPSVLILDDGSVVEGPPASRSWDVMVAAGLGFDYSMAANWRAGASVSAVQAFPLRGTRFQAIEGSAYVAHHWQW